jgi:hypothetical protein
VGDDDGPAVGEDALEEPAEQRGGVDVEGGRGLVEKQQLGVGGESPGHPCGGPPPSPRPDIHAGDGRQDSRTNPHRRRRQRLPTAGHLAASYAGLGPVTWRSGTSIRGDHASRRGNELRSVLQKYLMIPKLISLSRAAPKKPGGCLGPLLGRN